jgi:hypothetical protein
MRVPSAEADGQHGDAHQAQRLALDAGARSERGSDALAPDEHMRCVHMHTLPQAIAGRGDTRTRARQAATHSRVTPATQHRTQRQTPGLAPAAVC